LLHVLPERFVKIRHFGLMAASNATTRLEQARQLLRPSDLVPSALAVLVLGLLVISDIARPRSNDWRDLLELLTGVDLRRCPVCGVGNMVCYLLPSTSGWDSS